MERLRALRPALDGSLHSAAAWFHSMTTERKRLHYAFNPATGRHEDRWCPIRDVGTAGDLAVLQRRLGSTAEFEPVIAATLQHYCGMLVRHAEGGAEPWCHLPAGRQGLGEPSSVAHSSMLLLALAAWGAHPDATQRRRLMAELAAGILRQQRPGGAFRIYFEPQGLPDSGWQLYGGEAAFALATACGPLADSRLVRAACVALRAYQAMHRQGEVDRDELVFFANWQLQAAAAAHRHTADPEQRRALAAYLRELQDDVVQSGFFAGVAEARGGGDAPHQQATVEVACALEGLAHAMQGLLRDGAADAEQAQRLARYADCACVAAGFLLEAQVAPGPGVPAAAVGGFGHTQRRGSGQRVDVTGHVACSFVKLLEILDELERGGEQ